MPTWRSSRSSLRPWLNRGFSTVPVGSWWILERPKFFGDIQSQMWLLQLSNISLLSGWCPLLCSSMLHSEWLQETLPWWETNQYLRVSVASYWLQSYVLIVYESIQQINLWSGHWLDNYWELNKKWYLWQCGRFIAWDSIFKPSFGNTSWSLSKGEWGVFHYLQESHGTCQLQVPPKTPVHLWFIDLKRFILKRLKKPMGSILTDTILLMAWYFSQASKHIKYMDMIYKNIISRIYMYHISRIYIYINIRAGA